MAGSDQRESPAPGEVAPLLDVVLGDEFQRLLVERGRLGLRPPAPCLIGRFEEIRERAVVLAGLAPVNGQCRGGGPRPSGRRLEKLGN
jgi:hypothetical protein